MQILIYIPWVVWIGLGIYSFVFFDRLIRVAYNEHREIWEKNGRPRGFFWRAPECRFFTSQVARTTLMGIWLFYTPKWIAVSPLLRSWIRQYRWSGLMMNAVLVIWMLFIITHPEWRPR